MKHTTKELIAEFEYRKQERLAIMCSDQMPTPEQDRIANNEAREAINQIKAQEK